MPEPLFEKIRALLSKRRVGLHAELPELVSSPRPASVLVPLFMQGGQPFLVLTKRTEHLSHHPGQISFPGGGSDPVDGDASATALREAEEEIGLDRRAVDLLGPLDQLDTITGFRVSPFVGAIPAAYPFKAETAEVAQILQLPLQGFLAPGALAIEEREVFGALRQIHGYTVDGNLVWGATGRIVHHFLTLVAPMLRAPPPA